jgi:hypothetical protein
VDDGAVSSAKPAIMDVRSELAEIKAALLDLGASPPRERSVAFELEDHILLLAYDEDEHSTTIAIGGLHASETAHRLAAGLRAGGHDVLQVLPPMRPD